MFYDETKWRKWMESANVTYISYRDKLLRHYDELETEIGQLTGYNLETLRKLFAAGYTLTPPEYT